MKNKKKKTDSSHQRCTLTIKDLVDHKFLKVGDILYWKDQTGTKNFF